MATNPYTGEPIDTPPPADAAALDAAVGAAAGAFEATRRQPAFERADVLDRAAELVGGRRDELVEAIVAEVGKPVALAGAEVDRCVLTFTASAEEARREAGGPLSLGGHAAGAGHMGVVRRFPVGVVYGITPFNFPLNLVAHKVAPAVACGCAIVVKPSPRTTTAAMILGEIVNDAGAVPGQVGVVNVPNDLAQNPLGDPRVRHVSFTGSAAVGWDVRARAGRAGVTLELGGNAAVIVHGDADLPDAAARIANAAFAYAGQSCISVQRAIVQRRVYADFRRLLLAHVAENVRVGDPRDPGVTVGPLIDAASAGRVGRMLNDARAAGATLACGGDFSGPLGTVLPPTVVEDADSSLAVVADEAFAPLLVLSAYDDFDDAIAAANASRFGLQAGVFTNDLGRVLHAYESLEVGGVTVNQVPTWRFDPMPYGGVKDSGLGREGVRWAMDAFTEPRSLIVRR